MDQLGTALSAISHSARRAIIARLAEEGPARVTEIAEPFAMSLNAVSKHLKVLEQAGLIHRTRLGREHIIAFEPGPLREVARWIHPYEKFWAERLDRLGAFFQQDGSTDTE